MPTGAPTVLQDVFVKQEDENATTTTTATVCLSLLLTIKDSWKNISQSCPVMKRCGKLDVLCYGYATPISSLSPTMTLFKICHISSCIPCCCRWNSEHTEGESKVNSFPEDDDNQIMAGCTICAVVLLLKNNAT